MSYNSFVVLSFRRSDDPEGGVVIETFEELERAQRQVEIYGSSYSPILLETFADHNGCGLRPVNQSAAASIEKAPQVFDGLPELREGEVYAIDDYSYYAEAVEDHQTFDTPQALFEALSKIADDRGLGTNNHSCRPTVYIRRRDMVPFRVNRTVAFGE